MNSEISRACIVLAEIYGWFTEGFDTDLKDAKALLDELSSMRSSGG